MGDNTAQNYARIDPATGLVLFDFPGHISADGVDLLAVDFGTTPPDDRKVRWTREADGTEVGWIAAFDQGDTIAVHGETGASLSAGQDRSLRYEANGQVDVDFGPNLVAQAGDQRVYVIGEDGTSSLARANRPGDFFTPTHTRIHGPYYAGPFALGAGADDAETIDLLVGIPAEMVVVGALSGLNAQFCTWSWDVSASLNSVDIKIANLGGFDAEPIVSFSVITTI